jgi:hypothetical protein
LIPCRHEQDFRSWDVDQSWLLPRSVHEFVSSGHLAHFVRDTVREALDLAAILGVDTEERGQPPYHPDVLVALLLYGYSRGCIPAGNRSVPARSAWTLWP